MQAPASCSDQTNLQLEPSSDLINHPIYSQSLKNIPSPHHCHATNQPFFSIYSHHFSPTLLASSHWSNYSTPPMKHTFLNLSIKISSHSSCIQSSHSSFYQCNHIAPFDRSAIRTPVLQILSVKGSQRVQEESWSEVALELPHVYVWLTIPRVASHSSGVTPRD